ncbi:MAG: DUF2339 domain-containing protein [Minisyncoccia bacterium]
MLTFTIFILLIIVLVSFAGLRNRIERLESFVKKLEKEIKSLSEKTYEELKQYEQAKQIETEMQQPYPLNISTNQPAQQVEYIKQEQFKPHFEAQSHQWNNFIQWLKEDWILKLGAFLLIIGFGWFITYAFLNNWIGPIGRIALGIIAGTLFIMLGYWRIRKYVNQGGTFLVLGSTIILLTLFAARMIYGFFSPTSALFVMFLSTAFVAFASVKYNVRALALLSLFLASIAPLLVKSPPNDHVGLFAYLFIVILGAIWITALTNLRELIFSALIVVLLYSIPHLFFQKEFPLVDLQKLLLFAYGFGALFFLANTASILKSQDQKNTADILTAAGNGLFLITWIMVAAKDELKSLIIIAWMLVFIVASFLIFKITQKRHPFYVYAGVGIVMLAAATSAELKGATLTIVYTIESGIISLIAYAVLKDVKIATRMNLLLIGPILLSLNSVFSKSWLTSAINKDFFVLLTLSLIMMTTGYFLGSRSKEVNDSETKQLNAAVVIIGSIYGYILLWLSLHAGLTNGNFATTISLAMYTVVGLITYFYGFSKNKKVFYLYGGIVVGFVVLRLLFVDIWAMEITGRIITFFLIGALLISTAFLTKKKRDNEIVKNF